MGPIIPYLVGLFQTVMINFNYLEILTHIKHSEKILVMRKFIATIILIFCFHSWTNADDITDFEIEGFSLGDKLSKTMTKKEINENIIPYFQDQRKYYIVGKTNNLSQYDQIEFYIKSNDNNYEIRTIAAGNFTKNLDSCLEKKKEIVNDLDQLFSNIKRRTGKKKHEADPKGNSFQYIEQYDFNFPNHIRVECTDYSEEMINSGLASNTLSIVIMTKEISDWISGGYK